jgi:endonuclease G
MQLPVLPASTTILMVKPQYVLSYNNKTHIANWVSWQLNRSWIGAAVSQDNFRPHDALPAEAYKVRPSEYTGSGYDRGHIAPSADRTRNEADNSSTFLMTNMMPQVPEVNRGVWGDLSEYCRQLVQRRARNFTSLQGPWGGRAASAERKKLQYPQRIGKLSRC